MSLKVEWKATCTRCPWRRMDGLSSPPTRRALTCGAWTRVSDTRSTRWLTKGSRIGSHLFQVLLITSSLSPLSFSTPSQTGTSTFATIASDRTSPNSLASSSVQPPKTSTATFIASGWTMYLRPRSCQTKTNWFRETTWVLNFGTCGWADICTLQAPVKRWSEIFRSSTQQAR